MLAINGSLQVIPNAIATDVGELRAEDKTEPAIVQSFHCLSGTVQIIFPTAEVDRVIEGLKQAKENSDNSVRQSGDLYIPPNAEVGIKQAENFQKIQDEITTPNK